MGSLEGLAYIYIYILYIIFLRIHIISVSTVIYVPTYLYAVFFSCVICWDLQGGAAAALQLQIHDGRVRWPKTSHHSPENRWNSQPGI